MKSKLRNQSSGFFGGTCVGFDAWIRHPFGRSRAYYAIQFVKLNGKSVLSKKKKDKSKVKNISEMYFICWIFDINWRKMMIIRSRRRCRAPMTWKATTKLFNRTHMKNQMGEKKTAIGCSVPRCRIWSKSSHRVTMSEQKKIQKDDIESLK